MQSTQTRFPVFKANQVLTSGHLNEIFNYLGEQERMTRANLIGIGIVCGLEIGFDAAGVKILISKGCGITSEGYLAVLPDDLILGSFADYSVPEELAYPPFKDSGAKFSELLADGTEGATSLAKNATFLDDKAVVLFVELKKQDVHNCTQSSCDDNGAWVTAAVKPLLVRQQDLDGIISAAHDLGGGATAEDIEAAMLSKLNLPDLRLPRYDVPNGGIATSEQIYASFLKTFVDKKLVSATAKALGAAYDAFKPLLHQDANPFGAFISSLGFLEQVPGKPDQVCFLQYYYDFFDDLLQAYEEFRWQAAALASACCPSEKSFPRHLMLGLVHPENKPKTYRNRFLPSAATGEYSARSQEVQQLFSRLVEMIDCFTAAPELPLVRYGGFPDLQIRITPSSLGNESLSQKAIPYYYRQDGNPPLYRLWSFEKSKRNRSSQNLSYRAEEYNPPPPDFVAQPLSFDLDPYNFLRIEGHLRKNYQDVLRTLLYLKTQYRLPIEIVALHTGESDGTEPVDTSTEKCRFQDLEAAYAVLKEELASFLSREVRYFYNLPSQTPDTAKANDPAKAPTLPMLLKYEQNFSVAPNTFGRDFEDSLQAAGATLALQFAEKPKLALRQANLAAPDAPQTAAQANMLLTPLFIQINDQTSYLKNIVLGASKLYAELTSDLGHLDFVNLKSCYQDLENIAAAFEKFGAGKIDQKDPAAIAHWDEIDDRLAAILSQCRLEAFAALRQEYEKRVKEIQKKQSLVDFLQRHPGIQHKGGVPLGGTFVIVYHRISPTGSAQPAVASSAVSALPAARMLQTAALPKLLAPEFNTPLFAEAIKNISSDQTLASNPHVLNLISALNLDQGIKFELPKFGLSDSATKIISDTVGTLENGEVIADFYLPYLCCPDCASVQFILPKMPPIFSVQIGCPDKTAAPVTIAAKGGVPPYSVKVDNADYQELKDGPIALPAGPHTLTIRDAEGTESVAQKITVPDPIGLGIQKYQKYDDNSYSAILTISGGTPPYSVGGKTIANPYTSAPIQSGTTASIEVADANNCSAKIDVNYTLPNFTVQVGCTNDSGAAQVAVSPQGGVPPYSFKVDNGNYQELANPMVSLPSGTHTATIRDKYGAESVPQKIIIPSRLLIGTSYNCSADNASYTATLMISGGTPPYSVDNKKIKGASYTSDAIKSGAKASFTVSDANNCSLATDVYFVCAKPCALPCNGIALRRNFRFSLPVPGSKFTLDALSFTVQDSKGNKIDLNKGGEVANIINTLPVGADPNAAFQKSINELIAKNVGPDFLIFTNLPDQKPASTLHVDSWGIEYFECLPFEFRLDFSFAGTVPRVAGTTAAPVAAATPVTPTAGATISPALKARTGARVIPDVIAPTAPTEAAALQTIKASFTVSPKGSVIQITSGSASLANVAIPPFDGARIDKCNPPIKVENLCPAKLDLALQLVAPKVDGRTANLAVTALGKDLPVAYLWEVDGAVPIMANGPAALFTFDGPGQKPYAVTAFTKDGCKLISPPGQVEIKL